MHAEKPIYDVLAEKLPVWEAIGASGTVLKWIKDGVHYAMKGTPAPFF